jgi:hypothetical protein
MQCIASSSLLQWSRGSTCIREAPGHIGLTEAGKLFKGVSKSLLIIKTKKFWRRANFGLRDRHVLVNQGLLVYAIISGPLREEIIFRLMFDRLHCFIGGQSFRSLVSNSTVASSADRSETANTLDTTKQSPISYGRYLEGKNRLWFGRYPTKVLVSSLLFACSHINNWYVTPWSPVDFREALGLNPTTRLVATVAQATGALFRVSNI